MLAFPDATASSAFGSTVSTICPSTSLSPWIVTTVGSGPNERLRLDGYFNMIRVYATVALNMLYSI